MLVVNEWLPSFFVCREKMNDDDEFRCTPGAEKDPFFVEQKNKCSYLQKPQRSNTAATRHIAHGDGKGPLQQQQQGNIITQHHASLPAKHVRRCSKLSFGSSESKTWLQ
jgi:hypothetical protein